MWPPAPCAKTKSPPPADASAGSKIAEVSSAPTLTRQAARALTTGGAVDVDELVEAIDQRIGGHRGRQRPLVGHLLQEEHRLLGQIEQLTYGLGLFLGHLHLAQAGGGRPLLALADRLRDRGPLDARFHLAKDDEVGDVLALHRLHHAGERGFGFAFHVNPRDLLLVFRRLSHQACQARTSIGRGDKSLRDKEFISDFADSRNAKADGPGISLVRPGTVSAHASRRWWHL